MSSSPYFGNGVVTFYSFKGGVGRSMAVANVGRLLARASTPAGRETLLIDWDLDAPGLHRYFREAKPSGRGLIDYFQDLTEIVAKDPNFYAALGADDGAQTLARRLPIERYTVLSGEDRLRLMTAGSIDRAMMAKYQQKVARQDWAALFESYPFALQAFRRMLNERFMYTLIDSRTGVSDTTGLCTAILPDRLVAMFGPGAQNEPILQVVEAAIEFRRMSDDDRALVVFPLASRFDTNDLLGMQISMRSYDEKFKDLFQRAYGLTECDLSKYFDEVVLLYVPRYSNSENPVVDTEEPGYSGSLRRSYEALTHWLVDKPTPWLIE